jgi:uncharacterized protein (DUF924 family)
MHQERIAEICNFWFGHLDGGWTKEDKKNLWWYCPPETDEYIASTFASLHRCANLGELNDWQETPKGCLALIIVLDQFSRTIHRKTAQAFAYDNEALTICLSAIDSKKDTALTPVERAFLYIPLMHSENLGHHDTALVLYNKLVDLVEARHREAALGFVKGAEIHRDLISRFGRYPHRNLVLGRKSTPLELAYLDADPETFGQG